MKKEKKTDKQKDGIKSYNCYEENPAVNYFKSVQFWTQNDVSSYKYIFNWFWKFNLKSFD